MAVLTELVQHFVVLMLENRSYDLMLGGLRDPKYVGVASGRELPCEGPLGPTVAISHGLPPDRMGPDPKHGLLDVRRQIYGALPAEPKADMLGFARNYYERQLNRSEFHGDRAACMRDFMTIYAEDRLPVLHTLAKQYAVCTHWFSSLPSLTSPNRAFAHAGTSRGEFEQSTFEWFGLLRDITVFDLLPCNPGAWRVYHSGPPHLWLMGDEWLRDKKDNFRPFERFARDVRAGSLPTYTFIEPRHFDLLGSGTSQHPPHSVSAGERLIASVYDALLSNFALFEKTLFLIVYDEHGGFFDHVIPPGHLGWDDGLHAPHVVVPPDEKRAPGFGFDQLGVRVPAVLVTPWLDAGTTVGWAAAERALRQTFDHTSILATVDQLAPSAHVLRHSRRAQAATALNLPARPRVRRPEECPGPLLRGVALHDASGVALRMLEPVPLGTAVAHAETTPDSGPEKELLDAWEQRSGNRSWAELETHTDTLLAPSP